MPAQQRARIALADFPRTCGVYLVYDDEFAAGPLYIGKAHAQSIRDRWRKQHLKPRAGGSALRRSLGVHLAFVPEKLKRPSRYYRSDVEAKITTYLLNCFIQFFEADAEGVDKLEKRLIREKKPRLNVMQNDRGVL